jgi:hypothetical protein
MAKYWGQDLQRSRADVDSFGSTILRDFTHADKIFNPSGYALAPKFKFLFHTFFEINPDVYSKNIGTGDNFGVLVKTVKLPSFNIKTHELNQYNRKRIVQTKINYDPINITFHDDGINTITKLWDAYYSYYYKDSTNLRVFKGATGASVEPSQPGAGAASQNYNARNIYNPSITGDNNWGYIGETYANNSQLVKQPFFKNITVFGFNRHNFTAYTLINPMITKFDHDTYSYADGAGTMECKMDIAYETVVYNEGGLDGRTPDSIVQGFGLDATYDRQLSPITPVDNNGYVPGPGRYLDPEGGFIKSLKD